MSNEVAVIAPQAKRNALAEWTAQASQLEHLARMVTGSSLCPKGYVGKPNDAVVAMMMGDEIGLNPMQSLQNIAVINGKPSIYGDAAMALVRASGLLADIAEACDGKVATCTVLRKGNATPHVSKFSLEDARRAGLIGKQGPWTQYPERMMQMRARGFALRDVFADVLSGLITAEEAADMPPEALPALPPVSAPAAAQDAVEDVGSAVFALETCSTVDELKATAAGFAGKYHGEDKARLEKAYKGLLNRMKGGASSKLKALDPPFEPAPAEQENSDEQ